jgi:large subunit ribosomal protein L27
MSKHKAAGKLVQRVRPQPKFLGVKVASGQKVGIGDILIRQRGTKFGNGKNVKVGRDHSLYSVSEGIVKFGNRLGKRIISVLAK